MNEIALRFALGCGSAFAVAGCAGGASAGDATGVLAGKLAHCVDGRSFFFAEDARAPLPRRRLGSVRADTPVLTSGAGDAGFVEAAIPLSYDVDAAGAKILASRGLCAPGVRCFPASVTAELFPTDAGGFDFSLALVDEFAPYRGGRVIALAPSDIRSDGRGGCR